MDILDKYFLFNKIKKPKSNPAYYISRVKQVIFTWKKLKLQYDGVRYHLLTKIHGAGKQSKNGRGKGKRRNYITIY